MSNFRAHCVHDFGTSALELLRARLGGAVTLSVGQDITDGAEVDVLIAGRPTAEQLAACPSLRAVVIPWAGVGAQTFELLADRPSIALHNLHHNAGPSAEHALMLLLAAAKRVVPNDRRMRAHDWKDRGRDQPAVYLAGQRAVVVGMGAIGRRIAALCAGLGMEVVGVVTSAAPGEQRDGVPVLGADHLDDALGGARALLLAAPLTEATRGLIGAREIELLAADALIVNIARGPLVDEQALFEALQSGRLHGAGLDVWYRYPQPDEERTPPSAYPFEDLDNVVLTPHRAGSTDATDRLRMSALAALLLAFASGGEVPNLVDPVRGY